MSETEVEVVPGRDSAEINRQIERLKQDGLSRREISERVGIAESAVGRRRRSVRYRRDLEVTDG